MKIRTDFVSNSSSSSFVFVVKDYSDVSVSDYTIGFDDLIAERVQKWLDSGTCKLVEDEEFLSSWWLKDSHDENCYYCITNSALEVLPRSLHEKLLALGCVENATGQLCWQGNEQQRMAIIELLKNFISENHQDKWCLCEFTASDHEGETEIAEEDGWYHIPSNAVWSTSISNH